jgi:hypothetical protein
MSQADYEVIRGIAQAAANAYDGALDDKGEPIKVGLKREEGDVILDSRVIDGFKVKIHGDLLIVNYQSECHLKDVHAKGFENEVLGTINSVVKFLKKEYKKITGDALSLSDAEGVEPRVFVTKISKVRTNCDATKTYKIKSLKSVESVNTPSEGNRGIEGEFQKFIDQGGWGTRPKNDTRKKE